MVMRGVAQARRTDLDIYLAVVDSGTLAWYDMWSTDKAAIALGMRIDDLQRARISLVTLKSGCWL